MTPAFLTTIPFPWKPGRETQKVGIPDAYQKLCTRCKPARGTVRTHKNACTITSKKEVTDVVDESYLEREISAARLERRPYRINKAKLSSRQRQLLRLRSRAIPLVADSDPLDIIFEDDAFLVVSKPQFLKMHPSHRFEGGSLLNRCIGYLGYAPRILHRLDMVRSFVFCSVFGCYRFFFVLLFKSLYLRNHFHGLISLRYEHCCVL